MNSNLIHNFPSCEKFTIYHNQWALEFTYDLDGGYYAKVYDTDQFNSNPHVFEFGRFYAKTNVKLVEDGYSLHITQDARKDALCATLKSDALPDIQFTVAKNWFQ